MSSAADLAEVLKKYAALRTSWDARNIAICGQLLQDLKLLIINLTLMPTEGKGVEQKVKKNWNFMKLKRFFLF